MKVLLSLVLGLLALAAQPALARGCGNQPVRAMTYNIRLDTPSDGENRWTNRRDWMIQQVRWLAPDIVGFQEVLPNQRIDLASGLVGFELVGEGRDGQGRGEASPLGFATTRFRLDASGTFWLSPTPDRPSMGWDAAYPRIATWARLTSRCDRRTLLVVNTHWDHVGIAARRESGRQLAGWLAANRKRGESVVLLGDFNTDAASEGMLMLTAGGEIRDARLASASPPFGPLRSFNGFGSATSAKAEVIDHILVDQTWAVSRYAIVEQTVDGKLISDHFPVVAELLPRQGRDISSIRALPGNQTAIADPGGGYPYWLYRPNHRSTSQPLLIFLHGSGERGGPMEKVFEQGLPKVIAAGRELPFVVVSPHLGEGEVWDPEKLDRVLADVRKQTAIDPQRIYLTGLSLGGHGSWDWAVARPNVFAAIAPISGQGDPAKACTLATLPIWAFHGALDTVVAPEGTTAMAQAIKSCPQQVAGLLRATVYPDAGHDAWTRTYDDPGVYTWFLSHRRKGRGR